MGNFNKGSKFGGKRDGGGGRDRGRDRDRGPAEMHRAICNDCGNSCEVPFRPTGDKPVYCSDCFRNKNSDSRGSSDRGRGFGDKSRFNKERPRYNEGGRGEGGSRVGLEQVVAKLDKIISLLSSGEVEKTGPEKIVKAEKPAKKEVDVPAVKAEVKKTLKKVSAKKTVKKTSAKKSGVKKKK